MYVEMFHTAERVAHALREEVYDGSLVDFVKQGEYSQAGLLDAAQMQQDGDKFEEDLLQYLTKPQKHSLLKSIGLVLLRLEGSAQIVQQLREFRTKMVNGLEAPVSDTAEMAGDLPQKEKTFTGKIAGVAASLSAGLALRFLSTQEAKKAAVGQPESGVLEGI